MTMDNRKKILITGGQSMIASAFKSLYPDEVVCAGRKDLDITDTGAVRFWLESGLYHTVINTAGLSSRSTFDMYGINARYPFHLAEICAAMGIRFVMLSSTRVFDGMKDTPYIETDEPNPVDDYGQSKYLGEILVRSLAWTVPYYIFRLPLVLGCRQWNRNAQIVTRLIDQAKREKTIKVASDVFHSPVHVDVAVTAMMECLMNPMPLGIYHVSRSEPVRLFDLMSDVIETLGISTDIEPVAASVIDPNHPFPRYQAMASHKIKIGSSLAADIERFVKEEVLSKDEGKV